MFEYYNLEEKEAQEKYKEQSKQIPLVVLPPSRLNKKQTAMLVSRLMAKYEEKIKTQEFFKDHKYILSYLPTDLASAFSMYYGLDDGRFMSLKEIGDNLGLSAKIIKQLLVEAHYIVNDSRIASCHLTDADFGGVEFNELDNRNLINKMIDKLLTEKAETIREERATKFSKQEKQACALLNQILYLPTEDFLRELNIDNEKIKKIVGDCVIDNDEDTVDYVLLLLKTPKQELVSKGLQDVIDAVEALGLRFKEGFEYEEDYKLASCKSMLNVGLNKSVRLVTALDAQCAKLEEQWALEDAIIWTPIAELNHLSKKTRKELASLGIKNVWDIIRKPENYNANMLSQTAMEQVTKAINGIGLDFIAKDTDEEEYKDLLIHMSTD